DRLLSQERIFPCDGGTGITNGRHEPPGQRYLSHPVEAARALRGDSRYGYRAGGGSRPGAQPALNKSQNSWGLLEDRIVLLAEKTGEGYNSSQIGDGKAPVSCKPGSATFSKI